MNILKSVLDIYVYMFCIGDHQHNFWAARLLIFVLAQKKILTVYVNVLFYFKNNSYQNFNIEKEKLNRT